MRRVVEAVVNDLVREHRPTMLAVSFAVLSHRSQSNHVAVRWPRVYARQPAPGNTGAVLTMVRAAGHGGASTRRARVVVFRPANPAPLRDRSKLRPQPLPTAVPQRDGWRTCSSGRRASTIGKTCARAFSSR